MLTNLPLPEKPIQCEVCCKHVQYYSHLTYDCFTDTYVCTEECRQVACEACEGIINE